MYLLQPYRDVITYQWEIKKIWNFREKIRAAFNSL